MDKTKILGKDVRKVHKFGNSLAVTIPKEYADFHGITKESFLNVYYHGTILRFEPVTDEEILKKVGNNV